MRPNCFSPFLPPPTVIKVDPNAKGQDRLPNHVITVTGHNSGLMSRSLCHQLLITNGDRDLAVTTQWQFNIKKGLFGFNKRKNDMHYDDEPTGNLPPVLHILSPLGQVILCHFYRSIPSRPSDSQAWKLTSPSNCGKLRLNNCECSRG